MTWLSCVEPTDEAIERASVLLEDRPDVRAALSPVVVIKYLASRDTLGKRKRFRQVRKRLQERQRLRAQGDARRQGRAQPRHDAPDSRRSGDHRPTPRHAGRPPRVPLEPRRGSLAPGGRLPPGGPPLRHAIRPPRHGQRRPLARGRLPPDRACPLAAHVSTPARSASGTTWSASCSTSPWRASGSTG